MPALMRNAMRGGALAAVALVLLPPLHRDAELLFAAHMMQHLLLIAAAAPLLAASGSLDVLTRNATGKSLVQPVRAWVLFVAIFLFWHWPDAFRWAAQAEWSRLLELASVLAAACVFWTAALSPENPAAMSGGARALFVMTAAVATDLPGVIMLFAPRALCTMPAENAQAFGFTPLEDQQIAGLLMWVPANIVFFAIATWLFAQWISDTEPQRGHTSRPTF